MFDDVCRWLKRIVLGLFAGHDSMIYFAVHHFKVMDFFANSFSKLKQLQPGMIEWKSAPVGWRSSLYQTAIKQPKKLVNLMVLTSDYKSCQMDKWIQSIKDMVDHGQKSNTNHGTQMGFQAAGCRYMAEASKWWALVAALGSFRWGSFTVSCCILPLFPWWVCMWRPMQPLLPVPQSLSIQVSLGVFWYFFSILVLQWIKMSSELYAITVI